MKKGNDNLVESKKKKKGLRKISFIKKYLLKNILLIWLFLGVPLSVYYHISYIKETPKITYSTNKTKYKKKKSKKRKKRKRKRVKHRSRTRIRKKQIKNIPKNYYSNKIKENRDIVIIITVLGGVIIYGITRVMKQKRIEQKELENQLSELEDDNYNSDFDFEKADEIFGFSKRNKL